MIHIGREHVTFTLGPNHVPAATISSGEYALFETYDCFHNQLLDETADFSSINRNLVNPATGPLYIEGAEPGDRLRVDILDIRLGPIGVTDVGPENHCLAGLLQTEKIWRLSVQDGDIHINDKISLPINPMIGVIGTAPVNQEVSTLTPMNHGGNMDCSQIKKGATVYLPVNVPGGLLSMGDLHASMGDGEVLNCGLEIEGTVFVRVMVEKQALIHPLVETEDKWIVIASEATVEAAWKQAVRYMFLFLTEEILIEETEAAMLLNLVCHLVICQTVNPMKTVRMEIAKTVINQYKRGKS